MTGAVVHFTLPADDSDRARKFYTGVFGWKMQVVPGMDYTMVTTGPVDDQGQEKGPGYIGGGIGKRGDQVVHPAVTIRVDDILAAETTIEKSGGKIIQKKQPIGDGTMGHTGMFEDTEGNLVGLFQAGARR